MTPVRLLCVESDAGFGLLYQALLRSHGFSVDLATDSSSVFELLHSSQIGGALTAHDLQVREGEIGSFELAVECKRRLAGLPVVILSDCESVVEEARNFVDGAINKSAPLEILVELMRSLTGFRPAHKPFFFHPVDVSMRLPGPVSRPRVEPARFPLAS